MGSESRGRMVGRGRALRRDKAANEGKRVQRSTLSEAGGRRPGMGGGRSRKGGAAEDASAGRTEFRSRRPADPARKPETRFGRSAAGKPGMGSGRSRTGGAAEDASAGRTEFRSRRPADSARKPETRFGRSAAGRPGMGGRSRTGGAAEDASAGRTEFRSRRPADPARKPETRFGRSAAGRPGMGGGRSRTGGAAEDASAGRTEFRSRRPADPARKPETHIGRSAASRPARRLRTGRSAATGDQVNFTGTAGRSRKNLILARRNRPSRNQMMQELGYTSDRKKIKRHTEQEDLIRLNRFIANAGICSRREADTYITSGIVKVNGQIVTELGTKVTPHDEVRFDNRVITPERRVYILLNKPKDVVTTTDDPHAERTVMDIVRDACEERIYPVGRLDRNTTGLLLLTNDGDLSKRLTHPSHKVEKIYQVTLDRTVSVSDIRKLADGMDLEDGFIAADAVSFVEGHDKDTVGIQIHSGRNRVVRRMFEHLGYRVKALDRVSFAGLTKKNIPRGKWRFLAPREVSWLKMK